MRWPEGEKNPLGGDSLTPFGLGCNEWQALNVADYPALKFDGLHIFQWGNMLSTQKLSELWSQMIAPLSQLAGDLNISLKILDLGGGLGIPYTQSETTLDWDDLITALAKIKNDAGVEELWMELGRYAVGECGHYANPVVERKQNYNQEQVILSGGINHLLRPAVTSQDFPAALLRESSAKTQAVTLYGPLCTALDCLGEHNLPSDLNEHDWLVFSQCGAYGFTESMPYFLCHELAAEYTLQNGDTYLCSPSRKCQPLFKVISMSNTTHISQENIVVGEVANGLPLTIPVYRLKGDGTGPSVYIQANMHGAEVQGNAVIFQLLEQLKHLNLNGDITLSTLCKSDWL